jgi:hypothetical protein
MSVDRSRVVFESGAGARREGDARSSVVVDPIRREHDVGQPRLQIPEAYNLTHDRVRWGPVWAGFFTALTSLVLLSLLGAAIGLAALDVQNAASQNNLPSGTSTAAAVWGALSGLVAFFLGGFVAGRTAAVFDRKWGAWNGALVFLMGLPVTLLLASMGLGSLLGTVGSFVTAQASAVQNAAQAVQPGQIPNVQPSDVARTASAVRNAALGTLVGALLALGASALGGMAGTRRTIAADRATADITR